MKTKEIIKRKELSSSVWFSFAILYLVIDYGRPQYFLPIGFMRPALLVIIILTLFLITTGLIHNAKSKQTSLILLFIVLIAGYIPFARNNYYAYTTFMTMIRYLPFIFSLMICIDSFSRLKTMIMVCTVLMIHVSIFSLFNGGHGPGHYLFDENDLSLYINTWIPFCYYLFFYEKKLEVKLLYLAGLVAGLLAVVNSFSRGGYLGLVSVAIIIWLFSTRKLVTIIFIGIFAGVIFISGGDKYLQEISTITNPEDRTRVERILSWTAAWDMFLDNPLGVGGNNFQVRFPEYQPQEMERGMWGRVAHSLWFTLIPELGVIGIYLYMSLLYYNIKDIFFLKRFQGGYKRDEPLYYHALSLAFIASFVGYFSSATFLSVLYYAHYWYLIAILVPTVKLARSYKEKHFQDVNLLSTDGT